VLSLGNLRVDVIRPTTFGCVAGGIDKVALFLAAWAGLGRRGSLQGVAAVGTLPPVLGFFHFDPPWLLELFQGGDDLVDVQYLFERIRFF
jgi:hypothetical protein